MLDLGSTSSMPVFRLSLRSSNSRKNENIPLFDPNTLNIFCAILYGMARISAQLLSISLIRSKNNPEQENLLG